MNIGFTGTRHGLTSLQREALESVLLRECGWGGEVHHGDCVGADEQCHDAARRHDLRIVIHPPDVGTLRANCVGDLVLGPRPYLERNRAIVDATDALVACPDGRKEKQRSGTWYTVRYARRSGKPLVLIFPDGSLEREDAK
jgi:hypothetical protein